MCSQVTDHPYLTLVDTQSHDPQADEFAPLPYYPWDERPPALPLDHDECATAIHLGMGSLPAAAQLLKVPLFRLARSVRASPRLQKVQHESLSLGLEKAKGKVLDALDETDIDGNPNHRRQEWAVGILLRSRLAQGDPFSPAPPQQSNSSASVTVDTQKKSLTFRWKTSEDAMTAIEHDDINPDG